MKYMFGPHTTCGPDRTPAWQEYVSRQRNSVARPLNVIIISERISTIIWFESFSKIIIFKYRSKAYSAMSRKLFFLWELLYTPEYWRPFSLREVDSINYCSFNGQCVLETTCDGRPWRPLSSTATVVTRRSLLNRSNTADLADWGFSL